MAPRSKRQKRAPAKKGEEADSAHATTPSSSATREPTLDLFYMLPHELRTRIIELACRSPPPPKVSKSRWDHSEGQKSIVPPLLDMATTLSLLLASKPLFDLAARLLYRDVMLFRPSALASFHQAVTSHPQLGELVLNLHVGPMNELPDEWNPLKEREGYYASDWSDAELSSPPYHPTCMQLRTSVQEHEQPALTLPSGKSTYRWGVAGDEICLGGEDRPTWHGCDDVLHAVEVAQRTIDVDLHHDGYAYHGYVELSNVEYMARAFEVQAVMDLCYYELSRRQAKYGINYPFEAGKGDKPSCLPLVLTGYSLAPGNDDGQTKNKASDEPWVLSRADLLRQINRRGSPTDRFDTPLLFARSGIDLNTNVGRDDRRCKLFGTTVYGEGKDWADLFSPSAGLTAAASSRSQEVIDVSLPQMHTLGSLLAQLRTVLLATPNVENLSLTGFLERAVCGTRSVGPLLPNLRALNLGPPPEVWLGPMLFDRLSQVQELRIGGVELMEEEAARIGSLHGLKHLQWSLPGLLSTKYAEKLPTVINLLIGRDETKAAAAAAAAVIAAPAKSSPLHCFEKADDAHEKAPSDASGSSSSSASTHARTLAAPLIEVRLHAKDLDALLKKAPSDQVKEAWKTGGLLDGQARRLLLVESKARTYGRWWEAVTCWPLYNEGREWWDEKGGLVRLEKKGGAYTE